MPTENRIFHCQIHQDKTFSAPITYDEELTSKGLGDSLKKLFSQTEPSEPIKKYIWIKCPHCDVGEHEYEITI